MKDFFDTWKFKILIAIAVFLVGIMAYAGANGRLTAAPQELLSVAVAPFQRAAAAVSSGVASLWENYANIDAILEENQQLSEENASLRSQMVDYDKLKAENEAYKALANIQEQHQQGAGERFLWVVLPSALMTAPVSWLLHRAVQRISTEFKIDNGVV